MQGIYGASLSDVADDVAKHWQKQTLVGPTQFCLKKGFIPGVTLGTNLNQLNLELL